MRWLVTGAAGFIGTNLVSHLLENGHSVVALDDLSRPGSEMNLRYLEAAYSVTVHRIDVSDSDATNQISSICSATDAVAHLAGQVSFMNSLANPRRDFEVNALGSINILEYVRLHSPEAACIGMSSNKIYGDLEYVRFDEAELRFQAPDFPNGFDESLGLDFRGPYGCSKGTADQYFVDYGRMFGLRTVSLRQSSVYGPHQHPQSDQGWVAHLLQAALAGEGIQLNGRGKQVRDLLHASDLARLIEILGECVPAGGVSVNVGGGRDNSLSILELFNMIESWTQVPVNYRVGEPRPSDQLVFISNNARVQEMTGWSPSIAAVDGVESLFGSLR